MAGQGILIIIIPNDLPADEQEHSKEFPCSACSSSLTSRFRHHISPKLNLIDAIWVGNCVDRELKENSRSLDSF